MIKKISDIVTLNKETYKKNELPSFLNYLDTGNLTKDKVDEYKRLILGKDKIPSRAQRKVRPNTILYSTVRPNQEHFGFVENPIENLIVSTGFTTIDVSDENIDSKFLYFKLTQKHITSYLHTIGMNSVSAYPSISPNDIGSLKFDFPNLSTQKQIAKVLSNLDAKIEINNKINQELEAMAKTLYDYWFVQFDFPDKNGKPYKSSGGKMVFNEELKREIPIGWQSGVLSDIASITMGQSPSGSTYNEDGIGTVFYQGSTDFGSRFPTVRKYTTEPNRMAEENDLLLSVRAPVGTLNQAMEGCCIGRGLAALREKEGSISFLWSQMEYFKQIFDRRNTSGTTFGSITKDDLFSLKLCIPDKEILEKFKKIADPFHDKIVVNSKENQKLSELRDWLLPMLMNGQVSVGYAAQ
jgi:type I restriction enzyme S subunit